MKSIKHFEEIKAWKDARELANNIFSLTAGKSFKDDQGIGESLRREVGRVMAKLAEGSHMKSDEAFVPYVMSAREIATGLQSYLYLALDHKCVDDDEFKKIHDQIDALNGQLYLFGTYLKRSENKKIEASPNTISRMDLFDKIGD